MAGNEIALTQPKFKLGITGIIQNVFQGYKTTEQKKSKNCWKQIIIFHGRGAAGGLTPPWKNVFVSLNKSLEAAGVR